MFLCAAVVTRKDIETLKKKVDKTRLIFVESPKLTERSFTIVPVRSTLDTTVFDGTCVCSNL